VLVKVFADLVNTGNDLSVEWVRQYCQDEGPFHARIFQNTVSVESRSRKEVSWNNARLLRELQRTKTKEVVPLLFLLLLYYDGHTLSTHQFLTQRAERLSKRKFGTLLFHIEKTRLVTTLPSSNCKPTRKPGLLISGSKVPKLALLPSKNLKASLLKRVREQAL
jgi:hypothetical protein